MISLTWRSYLHFVHISSASLDAEWGPYVLNGSRFGEHGCGFVPKAVGLPGCRVTPSWASLQSEVKSILQCAYNVFIFKFQILKSFFPLVVSSQFGANLRCLFNPVLSSQPQIPPRNRCTLLWLTAGSAEKDPYFHRDKLLPIVACKTFHTQAANRNDIDSTQ